MKLNSTDFNNFVTKFVSVLPDYAYCKDKNGAYLSCNELFAEAAGLTSPDQIAGKTDNSMPWSKEAGVIRRAELEILHNKKVKKIEEILQLADGSKIHFLSTKTPLCSSTGELIGFLVISSKIQNIDKNINSSDSDQDQIALMNILNNVPAHIFWKDRDCVLLGCNDLQAKNMGFNSGKEMVGKTNYDVIWPDQPEEARRIQADAITKIDLEVMKTGRDHMIEEPLVLPDGSTKIYLSKKTPLRNNKNEVVGLLGIAFDITEKKQMEHDLWKANQMLENVINTIPGHVYWKDKNSVFLGCNNEQARDLGLKSKNDIVGLTAYDTLPKEDAEVVIDVDKEVIRTGKLKTTEEPETLPNGQKRIWLSRKAPLRNEHDEIIGILGVSLDVTEQKVAEQKLSEAEHKIGGMTLVSASFAHELRTPLASLRIGVQNLKDYIPDLLAGYRAAEEASLVSSKIGARELELLDQILGSFVSEIKAASFFIDTMLMNISPDSAAVASVESDQNIFFSIGTCVDEALSRYPFQPGERKLVRWESDRNDFAVKGRASLVIHILFNLLKNALYYIAKAGKGDIVIWLEQQGEFNKLYFKDTGTGISKSILPHIFEQFFSRTYHGAGIGLSFCKMVMESLDGKIDCTSQEGEYTQFILFFPNVAK